MSTLKTQFAFNSIFFGNLNVQIPHTHKKKKQIAPVDPLHKKIGANFMQSPPPRKKKNPTHFFV